MVVFCFVLVLVYNIFMDEEIKLKGKTEIDQALKEFEERSKAEEIQKAPETSATSELPRMVQLVIKYSGGAIKEQRQAEYVLLGFVVLIIIISLFLVFY